MKIILISIVSIVSLISILFGFGVLELEFMKFFGPKKENIRREIFENTKSYSHGKQMDLARYYEEYQKAESEKDKELIANLIKMQFGSFDDSQITNNQLKQFLITIRGF